jgi:hypothetical protein
VAPSAAKISGIAMTAPMAMMVVRLAFGMRDAACQTRAGRGAPASNHTAMRDRILPAAPVTCVACAADAFALATTVEDLAKGCVRVHLRCGACGLWQQHELDAATADRFREHLDVTQRQIARVLAAMLRAGATSG